MNLARSSFTYAVLFLCASTVACGSTSTSPDVGSDDADMIKAGETHKGSSSGSTPSPTCVFGSSFADLRENPDFEFVQEEWSVERGFSDLETKQIVTALHRSSNTDVTNVEDAFAAVDGEVMNHVRLTHRPTGKQYEAIEYGAGDNSFGAIFELGSADVLVSNYDDDLSDCR